LGTTACASTSPVYRTHTQTPHLSICDSVSALVSSNGFIEKVPMPTSAALVLAPTKAMESQGHGNGSYASTRKGRRDAASTHGNSSHKEDGNWRSAEHAERSQEVEGDNAASAIHTLAATNGYHMSLIAAINSMCTACDSRPGWLLCQVQPCKASSRATT
jgi:hypothetical protein